MANEPASFTLANNPAGSQINNELFLCAVFHTLLYVFCLFKIANIALVVIIAITVVRFYYMALPINNFLLLFLWS